MERSCKYRTEKVEVGGIWLVYRDITEKKVNGGRHPSFKFAVWSVSFPTGHLTLITINHPLRLQIHNDYLTHRLGNTLDLLITEINNQIQIDKCWASPFILDHCTIEASLSISGNDLMKKYITYQTLKDIQPEATAYDFDELTSEIMGGRTTKPGWSGRDMQPKLKAMLDNHAPMKERSITIRHTVPWFTTEIMAQKEGRKSGISMVKITNGNLGKQNIPNTNLY